MLDGTTSNQQPGPGLTLESLRRQIEMLGPIPAMPFFASSALFDSARAWTFQFQGRRHVGAHPDFWAKLPPEPYHLAYGPAHVPVLDLDLEVNAERRREFFRALQIIVTSGAGPIEDAIATAIERGYSAAPGQIINPNPAG